MKDYSYIFSKFAGKVVDTKDLNDPVAREIQKVAKDHGLTVRFNKVGQGCGATVMPPPNQVTINLTQGLDNKWRVHLGL